MAVPTARLVNATYRQGVHGFESVDADLFSADVPINCYASCICR